MANIGNTDVTWTNLGTNHAGVTEDTTHKSIDFDEIIQLNGTGHLKAEDIEIIMSGFNNTGSNDSELRASGQGFKVNVQTLFFGEDDNDDDYAVNFKNFSVTYANDNAEDSSSANNPARKDWSLGGAFQYNSGGKNTGLNVVQNYTRRDFLFRDGAFKFWQKYQASGFGGNGNEMKLKMINCSYRAMRLEDGSDDYIGAVPFFGDGGHFENCVFDTGGPTSGSNAGWEMFANNASLFKNCTLENSTKIKVERGGAAFFEGLKFGSGTKSYQYFNDADSNDSNHSQAAATDRYIRVVDSEVDNTEVQLSNGGGFMVYNSLDIQNWATTSGVNSYVMVTEEDSPEDNDYEYIPEHYNFDVNYSIQDTQLSGATDYYVITGDTNNNGPDNRRIEDIGAAFRVGDRLLVETDQSLLAGTYELEDAFYQGIFLPGKTDSIWSGNENDVDFTIEGPVSDGGVFNSYRIPVARAKRNASNSSASFAAGLINKTATGSGWYGGTRSSQPNDYYMERTKAKSVLIPPYPEAISIGEFDLTIEISNANAGTPLVHLPVIRNCDGVTETDPDVVGAYTASDLDTIDKVLEYLCWWKRQDRTHNSYPSHSGNSRYDLELFEVDGSLVTFNVTDVEFTTADQGSTLVTYTASNSDKGKLTIEVASTLSSTGNHDTLSLDGELTTTSVTLDGISYADENGVQVSINLPSGVSDTKYKGHTHEASEGQFENIIYTNGLANLDNFDVKFFKVAPTAYAADPISRPTNGTGLSAGDTWNDVEHVYIDPINISSGVKILYIKEDNENNYALFRVIPVSGHIGNFTVSRLIRGVGTPSVANGDSYSFSQLTTGDYLANNPTGYTTTNIGGTGIRTETGSTIEFTSSANLNVHIYVAPKGYDAKFLSFDSGQYGVIEDPNWTEYTNSLPATDVSWSTDLTSDWDYDDNKIVIENDTQDSNISSITTDQVGSLLWAILRTEGVADMYHDLNNPGFDYIHDESSSRLFVRQDAEWTKDDAISNDTEVACPLWTYLQGVEGTKATFTTPKNGNAEKAKWTFFNIDSTPTFDAHTVTAIVNDIVDDRFGTSPTNKVSDIVSELDDIKSAAEGAEALSA